VQDFADELRAGGHVVHTPDLFEGRIFTKLSGGMEYAKSVGFGTILERGVLAAGWASISGSKAIAMSGLCWWSTARPYTWRCSTRTTCRGDAQVGVAIS
jgi:hypothetical protein